MCRLPRLSRDERGADPLPGAPLPEYVICVDANKYNSIGETSILALTINTKSISVDQLQTATLLRALYTITASFASDYHRPSVETEL